MTRKEQNKILIDKIESNINQYKVDRLNAEISAFSSGDLNKYEFLTRKDLKYKPNALDKARFEFSPLGQTFSTGLDKTAQGYQEEGVIKLLKDIRDGLARGPQLPGAPPGQRAGAPPRHDNNDDDDNDDYNNDDNDDYNNDDINNKINNVQNATNNYINLIRYQSAAIDEFKKKLTDKETINKEIIEQATETIISIKEERLKYYNKYSQTLHGYSQALKQLNQAENVYGRETGVLNCIINNNKTEKNEFRNDIQNLENTIQEKLNEIEKIKNISKNDKKILQKKIDEVIDNNDKLEDFIEIYNDNVKEEQDKIYNSLNKFENNMNDKIHYFDKKFMSKENKLYSKLNRLKNKFKNLDEYFKKNNDKKVYTKNKLNRVINDFNARLNELHENKMEIATLKDNGETNKKIK